MTYFVYAWAFISISNGNLTTYTKGVEPKTTLRDFSSFQRNIGDTQGVIYTHVQNMVHQQMKKTIQFLF
jgi:hypothetical protein